jgi:hypothetical protein
MRLWVLCGAYALACFLLLPVTMALPVGDDPRMFFGSYPFCSVLTGFAFMVLGSNYWGRFYGFAAAFFVLAVVMPYFLDHASLAFGLLWSGALFAIGLHLRKLGRVERSGAVPQP